jgi:hypothetical protein
MGMQGRLLKERTVTKTTYGPAQEEQEEDPVVLGQAQNIAAAVNLASNLSPQLQKLGTYVHYGSFAGGVGLSSFFVFNALKGSWKWNQLGIASGMMLLSYMTRNKNARMY